jgi:uncharacterized SAM-binding protein YcdF (DUF218 family)
LKRGLKMDMWSRLKTGLGEGEGPENARRAGAQEERAPKAHGQEAEDRERTAFQTDSRPIEPESGRTGRLSILKWVIIGVLILYSLVSYFHIPILTRLGAYLVVAHPLKRADVIVCMMGQPVERGLSAAELYRQGLAPRVFLGREALPDGYFLLTEQGVQYPETRDLLLMMLEGLGVPRNACITRDRFLRSTLDEADEIRALAAHEGYRSLIVVTTPYHTRRTWLTLREALEGQDVEIMMAPSRYSDFRTQDWWKKRRYVKEVIIEYQKLIYYLLREI